jgi:TonB-dependent SusC/RagA subfamily outer membrane receptor
MKKRLFFVLLVIIGQCAVSAQNLGIKIKVSDAENLDALPGAVVTCNGKISSTNLEGMFEITSEAPNYIIDIKYIGYQNYSDTLSDAELKTTKEIKLKKSARQLDGVIISAGRYEQNISRVPVSIEIIKPALIENKNTVNLETIIDQVPGVNVIDGQVSIRGGSGFSYGAGSRVMMLVDDLPLLAGDAGDIKFSYLPVENIEQVEVLKGASSALYGSSALNGVINIRTGYAKDNPETKITTFHSVYDNPLRSATKWWPNANPTSNGASFYHGRKIKNFDLVVGSNYFNDEGYRQGEKEQRVRFNFNTRYRFKNVEGLSAGLNGNSQITKGALFILWNDKDSGALKPFPGSMSNYTTYRANIDPYVKWFTKGNVKHILRSRFFITNNTNDTQQDSKSTVSYNEYVFQKIIRTSLIVNAGIVYTKTNVYSDSLYGNHSGNNAAMYFQVDKNFKRLSLSLGGRGEYFSLNGIENKSDFTLIWKDKVIYSTPTKLRPVFRAGATYQLFEQTYLRTSLGQGYRYPTVAEKFVATSVGGLTVFPNPTILPETGYNAEVGIKQGFKIGNFFGYLDAAYFLSEYQNTIEYNFGYYIPETIKKPTLFTYIQYAGFKSVNVGNTRISGTDISLNGTGKIGKLGITLLSGYTCINPITLNKDSSYIFSGTDSSNVLKYRNRHSIKSDIQLDYGKFSVGYSVRYQSFMQNIDRAFQEPVLSDLVPGLNTGVYIVNGLKEYRQVHNTGKTICDARFSYRVNKGQKVSFIVNNLFNIELMGRPSDIQPMRTFILQYAINL